MIQVDKEKALALMQQALRDGTNPFPDLKINPGNDFVRDDPRFKELLRRIKLDR